jgi:hypothetical protein
LSNVLWIDDDNWQVERRILAGHGFNITWIRNASDLDVWLDNTQKMDNLLVLLDVMLIQGMSNSYSDTATHNGLRTGLVVAKKLLSAGAVGSSNLHLISQTNDPALLEAIKLFARDNKCGFTQKSRAIRGVSFVSWFKEIFNTN